MSDWFIVSLSQGGLAELQSLTQQEFIDKIHELNTVLRNSWGSNQKVKALKIAIQVQNLNPCVLDLFVVLK